MGKLELVGKKVESKKDSKYFIDPTSKKKSPERKNLSAKKEEDKSHSSFKNREHELMEEE